MQGKERGGRGRRFSDSCRAVKGDLWHVPELSREQSFGGRHLLAQEWSTYPKSSRSVRGELSRVAQGVEEIKVGSTIGVRCQLRDGSSGCLLGFLTLEGAAEKSV